MPLSVENRGKGFIGELGDNWRITANGSPAILGQSSGRLGSLSFSAGCDSTTLFTIDNYLSVKHFYDDQVTRWLATFDGYIRNVSTDGNYGNFSVSSLLSALDVQRTASVDAAGTYQRTFTVPAGTSYTIGATTYTIGGFWSSVGSQNVFVPRPVQIWDIAAEANYVYVLAAGQHLGEVVLRFGLDGYFYAVWPVYSDATDLASPDSRYISYSNGNLWIGQVNADRVKRFDTDGTFVSQWGSAGSADGQFGTIAGIAVNDSGLNAVYVTDSALGRVQAFDKTGTFLFKWGTSGTGTGNLVFNAPNGVSIDAKTNNVFISDRNARVREYTSGGGYVSQPMGSYNFSTSASTGEFMAGGYYIKTAFDHLGNAYAVQQGRVFKYARSATGWVGGSTLVKRWETLGAGDLTPPSMIAISSSQGVIHVPRGLDSIDQYAGSMGRLQAYILYYIALAAPNFKLRFLVMANASTTGELVYIGWEGNVWDMLCELCAATSNAMMASDDSLYFFDRSSRQTRLGDDLEVEPVRLDSRAAGQSIEIVNQNARYTTVPEVMYDAEKDNQRTFSVPRGSLTYITVAQDTYPEYLLDPTPHTAVANGRYVVRDANNIVVPPVRWTEYGASVRASIGERPGTIVLTITGPAQEIPSYESPYKISGGAAGDQPALSVMGGGIKVSPETIRIGTGVAESVTNRLVAQTIDSPFSYNATTAYAEGSWAAYNSGTPHQRVTFRVRTHRTPLWSSGVTGAGGTFQMINTMVRWRDALYIVEDLEYDAHEIVVSAYRYTPWGSVGVDSVDPRPEHIWSGKTAAEFDAYWAEYTAQDFTVAPLRNPYGV